MNALLRPAQMDSNLLGRYTKLQERLKAERRTLKILRTSAAEERGLRAQNLLTEASLPCVVGKVVQCRKSITALLTHVLTWASASPGRTQAKH